VRATTWVCAALTLVGIALASASAQAAIVHRWSFNTAGMAEDSVGPADGILHNGAVVAGGQLALTNAVMAPYMQMPSSGPGGININTFTNVTVTSWYTGPAVDPGGFRTLVALGKKVTQPGGEQHGAVVVGEGLGADYLFMQPWRGGGPVGASKGAITDSHFGGEIGGVGDERLDGLEHCYTLTVTKTATGADVRYFIDGVQQGATAAATFDLSALSNELAYVGRALYNDPALIGSVNEVRIYNEALSPANVMLECMRGPNGEPIPEPATLAIAALGLVGLVAARRRG
jgi:hypothetical protein